MSENVFKNPFLDNKQRSNFPGVDMDEDAEYERLIASYRIRYIKGNLDDDEFRSRVEQIETEGLRGERIVVLSREPFTFQDCMYITLRYMEKVTHG